MRKEGAITGRADDAQRAEQSCRRLLLVEDDELDARHLDRIFPTGWRVEHVQTLAEAEARLRTPGWDLAVLDWQLPDGDAGPLLRRCVEAMIPAVVVSGEDALRPSENALFELGALEFVDKNAATAEALARGFASALARAESLRRAVRSHQRRVLLESVAGTAHDLGNFVMAAADGLSLLALERNQLSDDGRDHLRQAILATRQARLSARRLAEHATAKAEEEGVAEVGRLLQGTLALLPVDAQQRVRLDLPTQPVWVRARPHALCRALLNLIKNALEAGRKASLEAGWVAVRCEVDNEGVAMTVLDSGSGFPERIDSSEVANPSFVHRRGRGIGLVAAAHDVRSMGGDLSLCRTEQGLFPRISMRTVSAPNPDPDMDAGAVVIYGDDLRWRRRVQLALARAGRTPVFEGNELDPRAVAGDRSRIVAVVDPRSVSARVCDLLNCRIGGADDFELVALSFASDSGLRVDADALIPDEVVEVADVQELTSWWQRRPA